MEKSLITRAEFRELCAIDGKPLSDNTLRQHVKRGKVVVNEDNLIDTSILKNKLYISERKELEKSGVVGINTSVLQEKQKVELAKAKEDLLMKEMQRLKLEGVLIPADKVKLIFKSHFKEMYQQLFFACEQISDDTIRRMGGTKSDIAEMKGALISILNKHIAKGRESSKNKIAEIQNEYKSIYDAKS